MNWLYRTRFLIHASIAIVLSGFRLRRDFPLRRTLRPIWVDIEKKPSRYDWSSPPGSSITTDLIASISVEAFKVISLPGLVCTISISMPLSPVNASTVVSFLPTLQLVAGAFQLRRSIGHPDHCNQPALTMTNEAIFNRALVIWNINAGRLIAS